MPKKTEIEIELSETIAYSRRDDRFESFCAACDASVEMGAPHVAAIIAHISEREIYRLIETNNVHFIGTDRIMICLNSLIDHKNKTEI